MRRKAESKQQNGVGKTHNVCRCAIYTRKSSEEGLEQDFNSLDAQRESCEAYILSQKGDGWIGLSVMYDDGGISGGTMERPALKRLLADIETGRVDTVVVYKVDRLTRSLSDFAKIVDIFDAKGVSFVSVTQQFNTTTSMGRLTLNMLLSFAQFEREVTGERIRDKIAASKKKGMWMGGLPPLGYDVPAGIAGEKSDRKLKFNSTEAKTVRHIFRRYAILKSVRALKEELDRDGIQSKLRVDRFGRQTGGKPIARGALYLMLQNRIYRGMIVHKGAAYPGLHDAIIDEQLWDQVQKILSENRVERTTRSKTTAPSPLAGLVYDASGERMSPTHANKKGTRYRYYVSQSLLKRGRPKASEAACRIPAADFETIVEEQICAMLRDEFFIHEIVGDATITRRKNLVEQAASLAERWSTLSASDRRAILKVLIDRIIIQPKTIDITIRINAISEIVKPDIDPLSLQTFLNGPTRELSVPAHLKRTGMETKLLIQGSRGPRKNKTDRSLLRLIGQAHRYRNILDAAAPNASMAEIAKSGGVSSSYFTRVLRLSFLAPDITKMILQGRQPHEFNAKMIISQGKLPTSWEMQKEQLGLN